jgi:hypothetical protein
MDENQKRQNLDNPLESQMNRTNNLRDAEEDSIRERSNPQEGDKMSASKMADRDTKTDEYRNSKLSDTEIGGE